jgi:hypothetical protein
VVRSRKGDGRLIAGACHFIRIFLLNSLVNLLAVDGDILGRVNPDTHLIPFDTKHCDVYFVTDH